MTMNATHRWATARSHWLLWVCLFLIIAAELLVSLVSAPIGLGLDAILLIGLTYFGAVGTPGSSRNLILALTVVPLIRLLSFSLPFASLHQLVWYPIVSLPVIIAGWHAIRLLGISCRELGLCKRELVAQVGLAGSGLGLGALEYMILKPGPLISDPAWGGILLAALGLIMFTGFIEELIFRGLLQSMGLRAMGRWALVYTSLLFASMHIGYRSLEEIAFAFVAGMLFAIIVLRSGSIIGTSLSHGTANLTLFLFMPYWAQAPSESVGAVAPLVIWAGTGIATLAILFMARSVIMVGAIRSGTSIVRSMRSLKRKSAPLRASLVRSKSSPVYLPVRTEDRLQPLGVVSSQVLNNIPGVRLGKRARHPRSVTLALWACALIIAAGSIYALSRWVLAPAGTTTD